MVLTVGNLHGGHRRISPLRSEVFHIILVPDQVGNAPLVASSGAAHQLPSAGPAKDEKQQSQQLGQAEIDEASKVMVLEHQILALQQEVKRLELALSRCEGVG